MRAGGTGGVGGGGRGFGSQGARGGALGPELHAGVRVLVKGSRGSAMDKIVKSLLASDAAADKGEPHAA